jgi:hypothetical protein
MNRVGGKDGMNRESGNDNLDSRDGVENNDNLDGGGTDQCISDLDPEVNCET